MEGWLLKWTNFFSGWKERFFVLKCPLLYYYYTKNDKPRGRIHLGISTINYEENDAYIEINTGSNLFYIQAHSDEEKKNWLNAIKLAKFEGEKQIRNSNNVNNIDNINNNVSIDYEKLQFLITKLDMDNQSFDNLMLKKAINVTEYQVLLQRYKEEVQQLKNIINNNKNENENENIENEHLNINENKHPKLRAKKKILNNNENDNNRSMKNYEVESIFHSDEEFFDLDDDDEINQDINDDFNKDIRVKDTITKNNPITGHLFKSKNKNNSDNRILNIKNENNSQIKSLFNNNNNNKKIYYDPLYNYKKRTKLPIPKKEISLNVWSFFKGAVGKDLNRFTVPVFFNEPISSLQKFVEFFQYVYLFNKGANEINPFLRLAYCGRFCIGEFVIANGSKAQFFMPQ